MPYRIPCIRSFMQKRELSCFQRLWRKNNRHNSTVASRIFPIECVQVGEQSYGTLHVLSFFPTIEPLRIGSYVSIAEDVHFILSGNHQTSTLSTYPIRSRLPNGSIQKIAGLKELSLSKMKFGLDTGLLFYRMSRLRKVYNPKSKHYN